MVLLLCDSGDDIEEGIDEIPISSSRKNVPNIHRAGTRVDGPRICVQFPDNDCHVRHEGANGRHDVNGLGTTVLPAVPDR